MNHRAMDTGSSGALRLASALSMAGGILITVAAAVTALRPVTLDEIVATAAGIAIGLVVVAGSIMIYYGSAGSVRLGGALAIAFGALSIFVGGGFILGLVLSVAGGLIALLKASETGRG